MYESSCATGRSEKCLLAAPFPHLDHDSESTATEPPQDTPARSRARKRAGASRPPAPHPQRKAFRNHPNGSPDKGSHEGVKPVDCEINAITAANPSNKAAAHAEP
ncbi:hypothetical protein SAMN05421595_0356 [Austwickia chelonae]|nr:hypothetical protein SAMN05421595_0356 [Austwickia chelonae]